MKQIIKVKYTNEDKNNEKINLFFESNFKSNQILFNNYFYFDNLLNLIYT
jgi:hypothetical protein